MIAMLPYFAMSLIAFASSIIAWNAGYITFAIINAVVSGVWIAVGFRAFNGVRR